MEPHDRLVARVDQEMDDLLATLQLVQGDPALRGHLFHRLVDLLVERLFLALRTAHRSGELPQAAYVEEVRALAELCRGVGLLPLGARDS